MNNGSQFGWLSFLSDPRVKLLGIVFIVILAFFGLYRIFSS